MTNAEREGPLVGSRYCDSSTVVLQLFWVVFSLDQPIGLLYVELRAFVTCHDGHP